MRHEVLFHPMSSDEFFMHHPMKAMRTLFFCRSIVSNLHIFVEGWSMQDVDHCCDVFGIFRFYVSVFWICVFRCWSITTSVYDGSPMLLSDIEYFVVLEYSLSDWSAFIRLWLRTSVDLIFLLLVLRNYFGCKQDSLFYLFCVVRWSVAPTHHLHPFVLSQISRKTSW